MPARHQRSGAIRQVAERSGLFTSQRLTSLVDLARRSLVGQLGHGGHDTAPGSRAIVIAGECQFVRASSALLKCVVAIAFEHELRRPPNVDLGYQSERLMKITAGAAMTLGNEANAKVQLIV